MVNPSDGEFMPLDSKKPSDRPAGPTFEPPDMEDVLLIGVHHRNKQRDPDVDVDAHVSPSAQSVAADLARTRLLIVVRDLGLRKWADIEAYLAKHGINLWQFDGAVSHTQLADYLELARAQEKRGLSSREDKKTWALLALDRLGAHGPNRRTTAARIANEVEGDPRKGPSYKHALAELGRLRLVAIRKGRKGGYWLTRAGLAHVTDLRLGDKKTVRTL
jgi:hypothetical protein